MHTHRAIRPGGAAGQGHVGKACTSCRAKGITQPAAPGPWAAASRPSPAPRPCLAPTPPPERSAPPAAPAHARAAPAGAASGCVSEMTAMLDAWPPLLVQQTEQARAGLLANFRLQCDSLSLTRSVGGGPTKGQDACAAILRHRPLEKTHLEGGVLPHGLRRGLLASQPLEQVGVLLVQHAAEGRQLRLAHLRQAPLRKLAHQQVHLQEAPLAAAVQQAVHLHSTPVVNTKLESPSLATTKAVGLAQIYALEACCYGVLQTSCNSSASLSRADCCNK